MAFQPVVPMSGIGGWKFLQATYDKQLQSFAKAPQIRNDRDYMIEKFAEPMTVEAFLKDSRLVRTTMTAFDLSGEEWKKGFIKKVLEEVNKPESTFLATIAVPFEEMGAQAVDAVDRIVVKKQPASSVAKGSYLFVDAVLVDTENVKQFMK